MDGLPARHKLRVTATAATDLRNEFITRRRADVGSDGTVDQTDEHHLADGVIDCWRCERERGVSPETSPDKRPKLPPREDDVKITHRSIGPEANEEKNIFFQKLFVFINIVPSKSDTISPTSF